MHRSLLASLALSYCTDFIESETHSTSLNVVGYVEIGMDYHCYHFIEY